MPNERILTEEEEILSVCPWAYYSCRLPAGEVCRLQKRLQEIKDIADWQKVASRALNCKHLGVILTRMQYQNRRLGVVV